MHLLIQGCKRNDRDSQRLLYQHYYSYALAICIRYSRSVAEAKEVVNDGFLKVFDRINQYNPDFSFKAWLRRIMINASIDQYRKEIRHAHVSSVGDAFAGHAQPLAINNLTHEELIGLVQRLTPAYRTVFNLYAIDGYTHREIASMLGISEGTSKSNLLKARSNLRSMLEGINKIPNEGANG